MTKSMNRFLQQDFIKFHGKLRFQVLKYHRVEEWGWNEVSEVQSGPSGGLSRAPWWVYAAVVVFFRPCLLTSCPRYSRYSSSPLSPHHVQFKYPQSSLPVSSFTPARWYPWGFLHFIEPVSALANSALFMCEHYLPPDFMPIFLQGQIPSLSNSDAMNIR